MMAPRVFLEKKELRIIYEDSCLISVLDHKKFRYVLAILFTILGFFMNFA